MESRATGAAGSRAVSDADGTDGRTAAVNDGSNAWSDLANQGPVVAVLLLFLGGFVKGWWVLGREYLAMREDRDYWRAAASRAAGLAETAVEAPTVRGTRRTAHVDS